LYAEIIIDIAHEAVDRVFEYRVPKELEGEAAIGKMASVPFGKGNQKRNGYIVRLKETSEFDPQKVKELLGIHDIEIGPQQRLIELAAWMKEEYGSTMIQALKTVLPIQQKTQAEETRTIRLLLSAEESGKKAAEYEKKHYHAKLRILNRLRSVGEISYSVLRKEEKISLSTLESMEKEGVLSVETKRSFRNPIKRVEDSRGIHPLNAEQQLVYEEFSRDYEAGIRKTYLLYGVTGSGKTEVYLSLIRKVIEQGKQVIVLIPEISLTYQTVNRFYTYFGDRVSFANSRLSRGEKYDQFLRAQKGEIDIMIGPRSALFTPFPNLGLIIIDEEHEGAYKSETSPKYHARETAKKTGGAFWGKPGAGLCHPVVRILHKSQAGHLPALDFTAPRQSDGTSGGFHRGPSDGIKRRQPFHVQPGTSGGDRGPVKQGRTDHVVFKPTWICRLYQLPGLRVCPEMSTLRYFPDLPPGRPDGLPLLWP
jgi:primosomal protein N' (replication factor Y)